MTVQVGEIQELKVLRSTKAGLYLDDGEKGILLPNRYVPAEAKAGQSIEVFVYHDNEGRLIATTQKPLAKLNDIAYLQVVDVNEQGAFLDIGIMKHVFMHKSNMLFPLKKGESCWVKLYIDLISGRLTASARLEDFVSNQNISLREKEAVDLIAYRKTEIGFVMVINKLHTGILHHNEIFQPVFLGKSYKGFIKKIYKSEQDQQQFKIDVLLGKVGYEKVEDEGAKIIRLLEENNGFLPFHDKSDPEDIYNYFAMSKKAFKMTLGNLYKNKQITILEKGIQLNR